MLELLISSLQHQVSFNFRILRELLKNHLLVLRQTVRDLLPTRHLIILFGQFQRRIERVLLVSLLTNLGIFVIHQGLQSCTIYVNSLFESILFFFNLLCGFSIKIYIDAWNSLLVKHFGVLVSKLVADLPSGVGSAKGESLCDRYFWGTILDFFVQSKSLWGGRLLCDSRFVILGERPLNNLQVSWIQGSLRKMRLKFSCHDLVFHFDALSDRASRLQPRILHATLLVKALIQPGSLLQIWINGLIRFGENVSCWSSSVYVATCWSCSLATWQFFVKSNKTRALVVIKCLLRLHFIVQSLLWYNLLERDRRGFSK